MQHKEITVRIKKLSHGDDLPLPSYATVQSAGMDLYAAVETTLTLKPMERSLIPTGVVAAIPEAFEGQIRPRSGLAAKHGVTVLNAPGTIDSDYRGEIKVCLINLSDQPYEIKRGDRIAQILISPVHRVIWNEMEEVLEEETERSVSGFGSSGS
ncbi:MAG: Deoxyuridine 5'-triphosphate nucleotidohydrolase [Wolbachia endosymbiont of Ctenocephalides orientis wCori]|nr:MAG: Deoxyuridine 5'-triphosphate nucleotidohydrolase [Wolbachia endosymbiont of Ctenocephalides orientis wCori]